MRFLKAEREALGRLAPGLDDRLAEYPLSELEQPSGPILSAFREAGGAGMLVPTEHGGSGATAWDSTLATRAIGARSPSLAVAATMHNFSVASLAALATHSESFEWILLDAIANDKLLLSSAFAEGRTGQGVFSPTMRATRAIDAKTSTGKPTEGWLITGSKKPCTLSKSADIITASVALERPDGGTDLGVALIPASSPGISVRPFWGSPVLTAAESDELVLERVLVDDKLMVRPEIDPGSELDELNTVGLIWFTLLITASYLGVASALVERLLATGRATPGHRANLIAEVESAMLTLRAVAVAVDTGHTGSDTLAEALMARYTTQGAIERTVTSTVELLGGISFVSSPDVSLLAGASRALTFHPPSRGLTGQSLDEYFAGKPLVIA